jgi:hypothetical protein
MVDAILNKRIKPVATERPFLDQMFRMGVEFGQLIMRSQWLILEAPQSSGFITSDDPFTIVPPRGSSQVGVAVPGTALFYPINKRYCVQLRFPGSGINFLKIDSNGVRIVNHNLAANSERFVIGSNRTQLEAVVKRSGTSGMDEGERFMIESVIENPNESLLKFTKHPRRYFYR